MKFKVGELVVRDIESGKVLRRYPSRVPLRFDRIEYHFNPPAELHTGDSAIFEPNWLGRLLRSRFRVHMALREYLKDWVAP